MHLSRSFSVLPELDDPAVVLTTEVLSHSGTRAIFALASGERVGAVPTALTKHWIGTIEKPSTIME